MNLNSPIYFDNAATTFPKPPSVITATMECMERYCGNPGRGSHPLAMRSAEQVYLAREAVAELFHAPSENVIFTLNTTYALNLAIKGVMAGGGHVLISNIEHNSVLRPVAKLAKDKKITYSIFDGYNGGDSSPRTILSSIISKMRRDTKLLVCAHSSNICSYSLPIREIGALCRRHGILFCVDAAQSAGHLPIDMEADSIDILCLPAHKGLYSPQGCGIMILRRGLQLDTLIEGGNGVSSLEPSMGTTSPERYEGGTLCTPAIAGLCAGIDFIKSYGIDEIAGHSRRLWLQAVERLKRIKNITVLDPTPGSVLLFTANNIPSDTLGEELGKNGFCLRTGYHCAALAHKALGTPDGGALRISFGVFNTADEVDLLCHELESMLR